MNPGDTVMVVLPTRELNYQLSNFGPDWHEFIRSVIGKTFTLCEAYKSTLVVSDGTKHLDGWSIERLNGFNRWLPSKWLALVKKWDGKCTCKWKGCKKKR